MRPRSFEEWLEAEKNKKHSLAVKYIEENVDLIDTDLEKFINDCPPICQMEVYEMLLKAGIDLTEYAVSASLKKWETFIHDVNPQFHQYYKIDYNEKIEEFRTEAIKREIDWLSDYIVLDTLGGVAD